MTPAHLFNQEERGSIYEHIEQMVEKTQLNRMFLRFIFFFAA